MHWKHLALVALAMTVGFALAPFVAGFAGNKASTRL